MESIHLRGTNQMQRFLRLSDVPERQQGVEIDHASPGTLHAGFEHKEAGFPDPITVHPGCHNAGRLCIPMRPLLDTSFHTVT